eukprot:comp11537_c0_seq1/m.5992 comp11537_c0_seq1/g.5992  ORF comp11537_c0_seq1/g.5992 comp11537_c0_seq1/m.5992 type:complete len:149 (-) comp11537_c0_seq1:478-924(-)
MSYRKLGRPTDHRLAMLKNLVTSLIKSERITTTYGRALELKREADKVITYGKRGDRNAFISCSAYLPEKEAVTKVFGPLAERFKTRPGGYTRVYRLPPRPSDKAPMAIVELMDNGFPPLKPKKTEVGVVELNTDAVAEAEPQYSVKSV